MSKKKKIILIIGVLSCIIISFIGGKSYSEYVTDVKGETMAKIATWKFIINGEKEEVKTINLVSTCDNQTLADNKIAPGTKGSFNILIDATGSDIGINYNIKFTEETTKPTNLKFIYNNKEYNNISELEEILSGTINAKEEDKTRILTINWEWKYETGNNESEIIKNDFIDTQDAKNITTYTFNVIVSGTQIVPKI